MYSFIQAVSKQTIYFKNSFIPVCHSLFMGFCFVLMCLALLSLVACGGGGGGSSETPTLTSDTTPNAFSFAAQTDAALNTSHTSSPITVSGIDAAADISISGGEYAVNGGAFTNEVATVNNGDTVVVQLTSSSNITTTTVATLTIGDVNGTFSVTTVSPVFSVLGRQTTLEFSWTLRNPHEYGKKCINKQSHKII